MQRICLVAVVAVLMLVAGCGSGGTGSGSLTGTGGTGAETSLSLGASVSSGPPAEGPVAQIVVQSVLARAVPPQVTSLRFRGTDLGGNPVFGPDIRAKQARIVLTVPTRVTLLTIDFLVGQTPIGTFPFPTPDLQAGSTLTIDDPAFVDVTGTSPGDSDTVGSGTVGSGSAAT